jgi:hypothetical protein
MQQNMKIVSQMEDTLFILTDLSWNLGYNELIREKKVALRQLD